MDSNYKAYDYSASFARIDTILAAASGNYTETHELPDRDELTFTNGFYGNCSALFIDIRDSSSLPSKYKRPKLAKLYRAYISESVAIMNSHPKAREINIVGDGAWAVYNTPYKSDINDVFDIAAKLNSLIKVLNYKLEKSGYAEGPIKVGIGASYGRALMIKAGYAGSGLNDVVYMGDVVNNAAKLAAKGNKDFYVPIVISSVFYSNLKEAYQEFCTQQWPGGCYTCSAVNIGMENWYKDNCK